MTIATFVDQEARLVKFTLSSTLETAEMLDAVDDALNQLEPGAQYDVLSDHRALAKPATPEQIRLLMAKLAARGQAFRRRRCAVVVSTEASYGMMRLMGVHAEAIGIHVGVFRNLEDAQAFVAVPPDSRAPRMPSQP